MDNQNYGRESIKAAPSLKQPNDVINYMNDQLYRIIPSVDGFKHDSQPEERGKRFKK
jgi:hypothetical protein